MVKEPENNNEKNERAEKPKKKNIIRLFRPQNSRTGAVKASKPGSEHRRPRPEGAAHPVKRRPAPEKAAGRPASESEELKAKTARAEKGAQAEAAEGTAEAAAKSAGAKTAEVSRTKVSSAAKTETAAASKENASAAAGAASASAAQKAVSAEKSGADVSANKESTASAPGEEKATARKAPGKTETKEQETHAAGPAQEKAGEKTARSETASAAAKTSSARTDASSGRARTGDTQRAGEGQRTGRGQGRYENRAGGGSASGRTGFRQDRPYGDRNSQGGRYTSSGQSRTGQSGQRGYGHGDNGGFRRGESSGNGGRYQGGSGSERRGGAGTGSRSFGHGGARGGAAADSRPTEKEGRYRNDRANAHNRNRNNREDKYERLEKNAQQNNLHGNKNNHKKQNAASKAPVQEEEQIRSITIPENITIKDLAAKMKVQPSQIIKKLFMQGKMITMNDEVDYETAENIALEYDILCEKEVKVNAIEELLKDTEDDPKDLKPRPPVVCVMGHVDHGKTSLLDAIRHTHVTDRESGGITQAIGASVVEINGRKITFLDTPGHEAFTAMRMRGANSTDIAVLVVAADDGVMPQTVEAINHARAAKIEIIVAINKIDKPGANVERVKQELSEYELIPEDWGGSTTFCEVSAKTGQGIDNLLEMILLTADVMELSANPNRRARGLVIEAKLDKGSGPVATVLVQKGTLHTGDPIAAGEFYGKVRIMRDDKHRVVKEAGPSMPVEIVGLNGVPNAGEIIVSPESEKDAKNFASTFIRENREQLIADTRKKMSLDDLYSEIKEGELKELNLIIKADVQGSVEALKQSLIKLSNEEVVVKVIHSAVGAIKESDVELASASNAVIIGFNVRPDSIAKSTAEHEGVDIRLYKVIYDAINDVESAMKGMLEPVYEEQVIGHAEIRQIFKASGVGNIAGSYVLDGTLERGCKARITRGKDQIFDGSVASLKRFKDDVKSVKSGFECGIVFDGFNDIAEGDQIEAYKMVEVPRT